MIKYIEKRNFIFSQKTRRQRVNSISIESLMIANSVSDLREVNKYSHHYIMLRKILMSFHWKKINNELYSYSIVLSVVFTVFNNQWSLNYKFKIK